MHSRTFFAALLAALKFCEPASAADAPRSLPKSHAGQEPALQVSGSALSTVASNEITVSDRDFNQFVFPAPILNGPIFAAGSPVLGKPVYLARNTQVLIQLQPGSDRVFDMVVECANGSVYTLHLKPRPISGVTHRVDGASARQGVPPIAADLSRAPPPRGAEIELLKRLVMGATPDGFEPATLPPLTRFNQFSVIPLMGWSDGVSRRVMSFSLVANSGQTTVVGASQFYRPGILAVMLDGDVVDASTSPTLYVVEERTDDGY